MVATYCGICEVYMGEDTTRQLCLKTRCEWSSPEERINATTRENIIKEEDVEEEDVAEEEEEDVEEEEEDVEERITSDNIIICRKIKKYSRKYIKYTKDKYLNKIKYYTNTLNEVK
jgi:hypothetical protein